MVLSIAALLMLPADRLTPPTVIGTLLFAALTGLVAHHWERVTPYILRHPFLVSADIFFAFTILAADGPSGPFFVATVLTSTVAGLLFSARGLTAVVTFQMATYYAALIVYTAWDSAFAEDWAQQVLNGQILAVHPLLYPVAGFVGIQLRKIFLQLAHEQHRREAAEAQAAAAEERARLARDMHDSVAKTLRGAAMAAQALPLWLKKDPERAAQTAQQVIEAADTAAKEARELISDLRQEQPDSAIEDILGEELEMWCAGSSLSGDLLADDRVDAPHLTVVARHEAVAIVRECLTNIERHAQATSVTVNLALGGRSQDVQGSLPQDHLVIRVTDNGRGFTPDDSEFHLGSDGIPVRPGHFGIVGMAERARRAGGRLEVSSTPGAGTEVVVRLPLIQDPDPSREAAQSWSSERTAR
ncbi:sensor histidine kinase [Nocardiopsis suaedae]|uniref:Histidine kinase n=1 Tax=Nocardiopsis suaedae TaxID=3018444 RepID=A0ABT4TRF8_9ACTN|nr:histidine kinase [Nocardiopsis suaedae]MDA2807270.1 histidine kinase [Nocardiopsis suaedae]